MKRVLVPLDGSEQSEAALEEAFELFPDAEIHVLHVLQVTKIGGEDLKSGYDLAVESGKEICETAADMATENGREIVTEMREGNATKVIVHYAEENDIDHIVMGSMGRSGLFRVLLGSVAEGVTRRAPCTVTICRE